MKGSNKELKKRTYYDLKRDHKKILAGGLRQKNFYSFLDIQVQFEKEAAKACRAFMVKYVLTQKQAHLLLIETRDQKFKYNPEMATEDEEQIMKNEKKKVLHEFKFTARYIIRFVRDHNLDGQRKNTNSVYFTAEEIQEEKERINSIISCYLLANIHNCDETGTF